MLTHQHRICVFRKQAHCGTHENAHRAKRSLIDTCGQPQGCCGWQSPLPSSGQALCWLQMRPAYAAMTGGSERKVQQPVCWIIQNRRCTHGESFWAVVYRHGDSHQHPESHELSWRDDTARQAMTPFLVTTAEHVGRHAREVMKGACAHPREDGEPSAETS